MKLNLGAGAHHISGYINVDANSEPRPDIISDFVTFSDELLEKCKEGVDEIVSFHVIEHVGREDGKKAIKQWFDVLKNGGKLVIECPNFAETIKYFWNGYRGKKGGYLDHPDRIWNVYGSQSDLWNYHKWGYYPESITKLLSEMGFINITVGEGTDYHTQSEPAMRVEAIKP